MTKNPESTPYRSVYEEGRSILSRDPGTAADAALDARLLLEEVCGTDLNTLLLQPERGVLPEQKERYLSLIRRRAGHEPLAMILGRWYFCGLEFKVTKDVLIPEQDSEVLIEEALRLLDAEKERAGKSIRVLDLCTGSGCLLLSLLHFLEERKKEGILLSGTGTDLSQAALRTARENAERLHMEKQTRFFQGDLFEALPEKEKGPFDLLISNPPYIKSGDIPCLPPEVRDGEPRMALDGGPSGMDFYRRIIPGAVGYLKKNGIIVLETGYDEAGDVAALLSEYGYGDIHVRQDYGGNDRAVTAKRVI